ncbi:small subunit ribosomal protein S15e [Enteropsectra breve]|nr:small subunit ribosomal protein S15e [Enteropsectra breve]
MVDAIKKRTFRQFSYKGKSLEELVDMPLSKFAELIPSNYKRHILRGINKYEDMLLKQVNAYQQEVSAGNKPAPIKTHERSMIIFPMMIGTTIAVYGGNGFYPIDIKPEMLGKRLRDYVPTRVICVHNRPGVGASSGSKFVPLK